MAVTIGGVKNSIQLKYLQEDGETKSTRTISGVNLADDIDSSAETGVVSGYTATGAYNFAQAVFTLVGATLGKETSIVQTRPLTNV